MDPFRDAVIGIRVFRRDRGGRHDNPGPESLQEINLLAAHLVRHREDRTVALDRGDHRQPEARVAARRLDDRPPGFQEPFRLGVLDHLLADSVLHASTGVHHLELREREAGDARHDFRQLDQGRVPDRVEDALDVR